MSYVPIVRHIFAFDENLEHTASAMKTQAGRIPPIESHPRRVLDLARLKGVLRPADLQGVKAARVTLTRLVTAGQLERMGSGLYRLPGAPVSEHETLAAVAAQAPQAVFCLLTALQFHGLTTQLPREVWIAMPRGSHVPRLDYPPLKMVQVSGEVLGAGVEAHVRDHVSLRVYGVARTVADCFKHRNKIGLDVALEALRDALKQKKATVDELWHYARICRVANVMRPYLEAMT